MGYFSQLYKTGDKKGYESQAIEFLVGDLLDRKLKGPTKSKQLSAMDMESSAPDIFIPSMFYTFMYTSPTIETAGKFKFKDRIPLILCTSNDGKYVTGLNFNMIPSNIRATILDMIVESNKSFYENKIYSTDSFIINNTFANSLIDENSRTEIFNIFNRKTGIKVSNSFRVYDMAYIMNPRMIEYDTWKYIPFLNFRDAIRGVELGKLQIEMASAEIDVSDSQINKL